METRDTEVSSTTTTAVRGSIYTELTRRLTTPAHISFGRAPTEPRIYFINTNYNRDVHLKFGREGERDEIVIAVVTIASN